MEHARLLGSRIMRLPRGLPRPGSITGAVPSLEHTYFPAVPVFAKRDDELWPLPGNKARKAYALMQQQHAQPSAGRASFASASGANEAPLTKVMAHTDQPPVHVNFPNQEFFATLCSYGGGQSNAMESLAQAAFLLHKPFHYFTRRLPEQLKESPRGNLQLALNHGMVLHDQAESALEAKQAAEQFARHSQDCLLVPQGIHGPLAEAGVKLLADEINSFVSTCAAASRFIVFLPSGRGTTAFYLARHLQCCARVSHVVACSVACTPEQLREEMSLLTPCAKDRIGSAGAGVEDCDEASRKLVVIDTRRKYRFSTPHVHLWAMFLELRAQGLEPDLVYAPKTWLAMGEWVETFMYSEGGGEGKGENENEQARVGLVYVHTGGQRGNSTMLERYAHRGMVL